jgi:hypothetical protein
VAENYFANLFANHGVDSNKRNSTVHEAVVKKNCRLYGNLKNCQTKKFAGILHLFQNSQLRREKMATRTEIEKPFRSMAARQEL